MKFLSLTTNKRSLIMSLAENIDIRVTVVGFSLHCFRCTFRPVLQKVMLTKSTKIYLQTPKAFNKIMKA